MSQPVSMIRFLLCLGILAVSAFSQTAQMTGAVTDSSGASVPGATVTATNVETRCFPIVRDKRSRQLPHHNAVSRPIHCYGIGLRIQANEARVVDIGRGTGGPVGLPYGGWGDERKRHRRSHGSNTRCRHQHDRNRCRESQDHRDPVERPKPTRSCWVYRPAFAIQGGFGGKNGSLNNFSSNGGLANANSVQVEGLALDLAQMNSPSFVPPVDCDAGIPRSDEHILGGIRANIRRSRQHEHQVRDKRVSRLGLRVPAKQGSERE